MELTNFKEALKLHKDKIDYATYWRYQNGQLPKLVFWIAKNPDLAQALADDARDLSQPKKENAA